MLQGFLLQMTNPGYSFNKQERLSSRKSILLLFEQGSSFFSYPFTVVWRLSEPLSGSHMQVAISVPKKLFKRAVDRNRIKRITREAWRYHKSELCAYLEQHDKHIVIMLVYAGKELPGQADMNVRITRLIEKFLLILQDVILPESEKEIPGK